MRYALFFYSPCAEEGHSFPAIEPETNLLELYKFIKHLVINGL